MSQLFTPITLRSLTIGNRAWMAPMCQYSAPESGPDTATPTDWHLAHLGSRAVGGAGLILTEATAVAAEGRISPFDLGLWNERQRTGHARVADFITAQGAVPGIQLAHSGRKASTERTWRGGGPISPADGGWTPVGASPVAFAEGHPVPHELSIDEIDRVIGDFAASARLALDAGYRVAEVHGAHGYLIHSFLSPHANHRTDSYGGSFDGRIRLALRVVEAVRSVWPEDLPVLFRVSATDWLSENPLDPRDGWTGEDTVRLAKELAAAGVDLLDVSTGGNATGAAIPVKPGYQVPFAAAVRRETGMPTAAVGLITEPTQAEEILVEGEADAVLLGRELLRNPYWPRQAEALLDGVADWPDPYHRAV